MIPSIATSFRIQSLSRRPREWLADALDTHLLMEPRVISFGRDPRARERLRATIAPPGSVLRLARLADRILLVMAIPDEAGITTGMRRSLAARWRTRNLLVVRESWLLRAPRLDVMMAAVGCIGRVPSRTDWLRIERHLLETGGSSCLDECAGLVRDEDPAGAVLALVAARWLRIEFSRPLSGSSTISLPDRRTRCGLMNGGRGYGHRKA